MRTVDLGRAAAQAEVIRIKRMVRRQAMRAVWGAVAAVFGIAFLAMLHVVGYQALILVVPPLAAAAIVLAVDLVFLAIFGLFALRGAPDPVEAEARVVRDNALAEMKQSLAMTALVTPLTGLVVRKAGGRPIYAALATALVGKFMANRRL